MRSVSRPISRPWKRWRRNILTMTKRRSSTPSRSTSPPRPTTRPTPISSRARPSSSRSSSRQPRHPGVAHYLIHLYDTPALAEKRPRCGEAIRRHCAGSPARLSTCRRTSSRASAPGTNSIASNIASARAAKDGKDFDEQLHAMDYMVYAYLQLAQDEKARAVVERDESRSPDIQSRPFRQAVCARRQPGALCGGARRLEGRGRAAGPAEQIRLRGCDDVFRSRARRCAHRQSRRRQGRHRQTGASCATSCVRPRTPIGPNRSISSGRSRVPGCSMPRANTMRRSKP